MQYIQQLLMPYQQHALSAWDRLRLGYSLCVHEGVEVKAFRGGQPEAYWLQVPEGYVHCGTIHSVGTAWQWDIMPDGNLELLKLEAVPESQLGFLLVQAAHFDHCY
ncbi:hypothetical protein SHAM105786_05760 [Shewanella amazonensis]|uniref:Uncharacterized protein n=1 Tax=Shewanella amazonensis (strain ATCC BAA-1098 / SB2B) TaxID=326297 RepID=A1S9A7_SHEAM|nr:hypothetical protein [Shewanella amazonensis]ABM00964.1 conserved hypothetical protein [Shewanella amazonensis SB2B]